MKLFAWRCLGCRASLIEPEGQEREPCPACGGTSRRADEEIHDELGILEHWRILGKRPGRRGRLFEMRNGADFYFKTGEWHHLVRNIDRENNYYLEKITRISDGVLVRFDERPLSEHQGHGSAKKRNGI